MKVMTITFSEQDSVAGVKQMDRKFKAGWETLTPLKLFDCGHYSTTLIKGELDDKMD